MSSPVQFESPIEQAMFHALQPELAPGLTIETQVPVGRYRVDLFIRSIRDVVIECDGRDFHDFAADQRRDIDLIHLGVHDIMRFKGSDIVFYPQVCVEEMRRMLPFLFTHSAESLSVQDKAMLAMRWKEMDVQPIHRCWSAQGVAQFKSPFWNRACEGNGYGIWAIT